MSELLMSKSCVEFSLVLAAKISMPGGGAAGALVGALGAALCSMAANFTIGNKKYTDFNDEAKTILEKSESLRKRLLELADEDAKAFPELAAAYKLPKDNPDRDEIYEQAAMNACKAPIEMIKCCVEAIDLIEIIAEKGNKMLITDAGGGALLCKAAMENAALNVFINTSTLKNNEAREIEANLNEILNAYGKKATIIADKVKKSLLPNKPQPVTEESDKLEEVRALFGLFATPVYRRFYNSEINFAERKVIKSEYNDGSFIAQWEYEAHNTALEHLNMLLVLTSNIQAIKFALGDLLQNEVILPGESDKLIQASGNYMIVAVKYLDKNFPEPPIFNDNAHCDITITDEARDNSVTGNIAFYGMPLLNGIRATNLGTVSILIYYIKCTA